MRKLFLLATLFALALPAPATAAQPVAAPEFVASFPALQPVEETARSAPATTSSGRLGPDELVLLAAGYWLLIGVFVLRRRATRRVERGDPVPAAGWVLGYAPPLPR